MQELLRVGGRAAIRAFRNAVAGEGSTTGYHKYIYGNTAPSSMTVGEAQKILGVPSLLTATPAEIQAKANRLLSQNDPESGGSPYLHAKVAAAREALLAALSERQKGK